MDESIARGLWSNLLIFIIGHLEYRDQRMLILFLCRVKGPSNFANQPCRLPGHILLTLNVNIDNQSHLDLLIEHTRTLPYHSCTMLLSLQSGLLPCIPELGLYELILL